jgi:hypothetical protein
LGAASSSSIDGRWRSLLVALLVLGASAGCASGDQWARPGAAPIARLAVMPFENQTPAVRAGQVASDLLTTELLARGGVGVMEPSEVADLLRRELLDPADAARLPSAQRVGRLLRVSHVLHGSVVEYRYKPGISETPVVGLTARVVEVSTGEVVWTASQARSGSSWLREDGLVSVTRAIARDMAGHLVARLGNGRR